MPGTACVGIIECLDAHYLLVSRNPIMFQRRFTKATIPRVSELCDSTVFSHFSKLFLYHDTALKGASDDNTTYILSMLIASQYVGHLS